MTNNLATFLGFITGLAVVAVVCIIIGRRRKKKGLPAAERDYDERQVLDRGNGYRLGFKAMQIIAVIYFCITLATGREWFQGTSIMWLMLCISSSTVVLYTSSHGSYFGLHSNVKRSFIALIIFEIADLFFAVWIISQYGGIFDDGQVSFIKTTNLFALIPLTACMISYIRFFRERAADEE